MEQNLELLKTEIDQLKEKIKKLEDRISYMEKVYPQEAYRSQTTCESLKQSTQEQDFYQEEVDPELIEMWQRILGIVRQELTDISFKTWIKDIGLLRLEEDIIYLTVSSEFVKGIIEARYGDLTA